MADGMKASILIVEDEADIADLIAAYLRREGIQTKICGTGEEGLSALREWPWDLVILDLNLPGIDGFQVLQELRRTSEVPVVIVSARQDDADIVLGLGIGADDFVTKPFSLKVLVARIRTRLRSRHEHDTHAEVYRFGTFQLEPESYLLRCDGKRVRIAPRELDLLVHLVRNAGSLRSPDEIYSAVWGARYGEISTVAVHIQRLRRKIEEDPSAPRFVVTVPGYGYAFAKEMLL